jgi:hypothetical protein
MEYSSPLTGLQLVLDFPSASRTMRPTQPWAECSTPFRIEEIAHRDVVNDKPGGEGRGEGGQMTRVERLKSKAKAA